MVEVQSSQHACWVMAAPTRSDNYFRVRQFRHDRPMCWPHAAPYAHSDITSCSVAGGVQSGCCAA